ncbi:MAG: amidohydrolase family protein, partial [Sphingomonas sp.]
MKSFVVIAVAGLLAGSAFAQEAAQVDRYIHAGSLLDRPGQAPRGASTIAVRGGVIVGVYDGHVMPLGDAPVIDLKDKTVLPGLIDSHVHLGSDRAGQEGLLAGFTESKELGAFEAQWNARKTLMAGFTTVRNLGDDGATLALREAIARGWADGPRIIDAGRSISTTSGHMDRRLGVVEDLHGAISTENLCDGADGCR